MKTHLKSYIKQIKTTPIYRPKKYSCWGPTQQETLLSVDRQRSDFRPLGKVVDRTVDRKLGLDLSVDRPRPGPFTESRSSLAVDLAVDQPLAVHVCAYRSTFWLSQSVGRPPANLVSKCKGIKTWSFYLQ